jgi:hemolysin D
VAATDAARAVVSAVAKPKQQLAVLHGGNGGHGALATRNVRLPALPPEAVQFLDDIDSVVDEPAPRWMRAATLLAASLLVSVLVITSIVKIEVVVRGSGHLAADQPTIVLQPMERSIVRDLKVKAGDVVTKGQVLATLDPTFSQADLDSLKSQEASLSTRIQRQEAELNGTPLAEKRGVSGEETIQMTIYRERMSQYTSRLRAFDEEIQKDETALRGMQEDRSALAHQVDVAKQVEKIRNDLLQEGMGRRTQYLEAQTARIQAERESQSLETRFAEMRHEVETKRAERETFINQWRGELLDGLARDRNDVAKVGDALRKATRMHDLVSVTAPQDGVVLDVAMRPAGSVVREAEPMISVLPSNAALIADVMVASDEIGYIRPDQNVAIKVNAFPYQRHGTLHGRVRSVSEESFAAGQSGQAQVGAPPSGSGGGAFHRVQVELTSTKLEMLPAGAHLIPGMTVTAELEVGKRTIISYLLDPIIQGFDESIREP